MIKKFNVLFSVFALLLCFGTFAFGQETTGDIEITVKDPTGAVVPNVSLTIASAEGSSTTGFRRTVTTDDQGFVRVIRIPPGLYTVTAAATSGFAERVIPSVPVGLGRVTPVTVELGVANVDPNTVTVNSTDVNPIDTTSTKIETTISAQTAELLPKGTNFASILKISPATRPEPRSGQFQIDGASGSENTFIIDGQEVTNVRTGVLDENSNLPFQIIQEVQIKSSGFEAEYGGATGGVINLVTRGGSNDYSGEFGAIFRPSGLNALGRPALRLDSRTTPAVAEYYPAQRDKYLEFNPAGRFSGPIIKDRIWFLGSYTPQIFTRTRNITYLTDATRLPTGRVETYKIRQVREYAFLRIDAQPFSRLRLTGTYIWNPIIQRGPNPFPGFTTALTTPPVLPGSNPPITGGQYLNNTGGRQNSQSITGNAVWTITNNFFVSARAGHYFLNEKLGTYGQGNPLIARLTCSASSPLQFPAGFGCLRGFNNGIPLVSNVLFDVTTRNTFDADGTFITNFGGRHEFKGGYQSNRIANQVNDRTTDQIVLRYGQTIASYSGVTGLPSAPGAVGAGQFVPISTRGNVSSKNEAIYIQDRWQPINRLTFNLGIRVERENVPSFAPGLPGIKFDFQDKIAPRLGVAYDLTGDGKTKISFFYGLFYDRFKYELPRGSFGGDEFHSLFFEIFPGDTLASFTRESILGNGGPIPGGSCPNTTTPIYGKIRCDRDNRISSNSGGLITEVGGVDPNIKAFQQSEFTVTFERTIGSNFLFSSRYTRKNVIHTVEDAGFPNAAGSEFYIIGNPGEGLYKQTAEGFGLRAIKPQRLYQALEFRFDRRFANNYYFNLNYTYSRLYGNYSGLASSDENGRLSPNVERYFDQPGAGYTLAGGEDNGLLSTDRPHVVKFNGAYNFNWGDRFSFGSGHETSFQVFTTIQSGTPITSVLSLNNIDTIITKRGDLGRTEVFTETDFGVRHSYRFGRDNRFTLIAEVDILNLFNEANVTNRDNLIDLTNDYNVTSLNSDAVNAACVASGNNQPCLIAGYKIFQVSGAPLIATQASSAANRSPLYDRASAFQGPRQVRFGLRFLF